MAKSRQEFADSVMRRLRNENLPSRGSFEHSLSEGLKASASPSRAFGHPAFMDLSLGETASTDAVAMFLDLRRFTARSFWDSPEQTLRVNVAVLTELAAAVEQHGGYVLGLRGDGVFACFDGREMLDRRAVAGIAVGAAAWALDAVQNALNGLLDLSGIAPVQVRAGLDYGRLDFVRIGSTSGSEVNVLGFAANFASKCEKVALAWEIVAGEALAGLLPAGDITEHEGSPAKYSRDGDTRRYRFFDVRTAGYLRHIQGVADELGGKPVSAVGVY